MTRTRLVLALGAALLLAGCDFAPHYKVPTVSVPASYRDTTIWRSATPADTGIRPDSWTGFGDPILDKLEAELNRQNLTLAAAAAAFDQARASAAQAEAGLLPSFGLEGGLAKTVAPSSTNTLAAHGLEPFFVQNTFAGSLSYELDIWGRIRNEVAAGRAAAQATGADLAFVRLSLQATLGSTYLLLRGLDAQQDLFLHTVAAYQQAFEIAENRFKGKISPEMDVTRAQAQLESARSQLHDVFAKRALAEHAIATLIGVPAPVFSIAPSLKPIHLPELPPAVPATLLQRRPDIAAAERRVAAANAMIGVARAAYFPNIELNAVAGFQSANLSVFNAPSEFWSLGATLRLPIFEGGFLNAQEAATIATYNAATANYRNTVLTAFQDVQDSLSQLRYYGNAEADDQRAVVAAQHTLDMAMALYKDGATDFLQVVVAQESLLGAQQHLLQLQTQYLQAGVQLMRALGGGWSEQDLPKTNGIGLYHETIAQ
jgi:NodT family efflux transporter outer membrane factor (OMF) lipoprotein